MSKAIRDAYGEALVEFGEKNKDIVVLDADVSSSTKSALFGKAYPKRFFNCGICESAMVGMAAGMAAGGKIPFVNTFAVFLTTIGSITARTLLSYSQLNVKLMGAYGGLSDAYDGATHQSLEDIASMRMLPNMTVMVASGEAITKWMVSAAIATPGSMYIRLSRDSFQECHNENQKFEIGKGVVVREGSDVTVLACGIMVSMAIQAAQSLEAKGIAVRVVDMFTIKPMDRAMVIKCANETGAIVTAEEHSIIGGLGSAVLETLAQEDIRVPVELVGTKDCHGESGNYQQLLQKYGLDCDAMISAIKKAISNK